MMVAELRQWRAPLALVDRAPPVAPEGGVVLRLLACGVCRSDWHVWVGADRDVSLPHVPGHEYCGEVISVGPGVRRWSKGDRVIAPFILSCGRCGDCMAGNQTICAEQELPGFTRPGAFAERVAVPHADANLAALPDALAPSLAAALGCRATTAWHALTGRAAVQAGEWLAIFGAGGVGLSALILGRAIGARVVVVDVVPERLDFARTLGAAAAVDARCGDAADQVRAVTKGGAHVALEALGIAETTVNAIRCLRKLGRMVQVGMPAGDHTTMPIPMDAVYSGQLAVFGTRGMPAHRYPSLLSMVAAGHVDLSPIIAREVALSRVSDELARFDTPGEPGVAVITDFTG